MLHILAKSTLHLWHFNCRMPPYFETGKENKKQNTTKRKNYFRKERKSSGFEKYHHKIFQSGYTAAISILFAADVIGPYAHWPRPSLPSSKNPPPSPSSVEDKISYEAASFTKKSFFGLSSSSRLFSRHQ